MSGRDEQGFVLIAVLWMLMALAALASAYSVYAVETGASASAPASRLEAEAALRAGVELTAFQELAWPKAARPHFGAFSTYVGKTRIDVAYRSENGRVDINGAPRAVIAGLFEQIGATHAQAGFLADRIVAWRGKLKASEQASEAALYAKAGLPYGPLGAPFDNALELALLPGMTPDLMQRALPYLTIFGSGEKIDLLAADATVLAALPGATPALVSGLLAAQNGPAPDTEALSALAGPLKDYLAASSGDYVRAEIVATLADRRVAGEVVLKISEGAPEPYEILSWRDDFDGAL